MTDNHQTNFNSIIIKNKKIFESERFINRLEQQFKFLPIDEKSQIRKQVDILKKAITSIKEDNLEENIYHLKIGLFKIEYQIARYLASRRQNENSVLGFKDFVFDITKETISDLKNLKNLSDDLKKIALEKIKKVYKDFLNCIIVKSYLKKST